MLRHAVVNGPTDRRREAESQLMSIRDADAVAPLVRVFGSDDRPQRMLLAHVLATISGPASTAALVKQILVEGDNDVRALVLEKLRERDEPGTVPRLIQALKANDLNVINRAAWALGNLNAVEAVPKLIPVLMSTDSQLVMVSPDELSPPTPAPGSGRNQQERPERGRDERPGGGTRGGCVRRDRGSLRCLRQQLAKPRDSPKPAVAVYTYKNAEVLNALYKADGTRLRIRRRRLGKLAAPVFNPNPKLGRKVPQP